MFQSNKRNHFSKFQKEWGTVTGGKKTQEEQKQSAAYFRHLIEKGKIKEPYIDEITWNDLDMDDIFERVDHTRSSVGEQYLYYLLRTPVSDQKQLNERERLIRLFSEDEELRLQLELCFEQIGKTKRYAISEYIDKLFLLKKESNFWHYFALFTIPAGLLLMMLLSVNAGFAILVCLVVFNILKYYKRKGEIEPYLSTFGYVLRMLDTTKEISGLKIEQIKQYTDQIMSVQTKFRKFRSGSYILMSANRTTGSLLDALLDYVRIVTHIDLIKFNSMLEEVKRNADQVDVLIENIGMLEAMLSVASFRESVPFYCTPDLTESREVFLKVKDVYHPLIKDPVVNSIETKRGILITGSNASGKSTFLKTIAVNAIFAQSIYTCPAVLYQSCFFQIYSSMAMKDNLQKKESYYIAEIKSLKRILNHTDGELPILCFIDEVLRGTNTVERIAASAQILKSLTKKQVLCFAATHDIELTHLLENEYSNYHFQEEVKENDVLFHYKLYKGRAVSRNAIRLLSMIGYEEEIIEKAEHTATHFLETGEWIL